MRLILAHNTVSSGLILNTVSTGVLITQNFYEIYPNSVSKGLITVSMGLILTQIGTGKN